MSECRHCDCLVIGAGPAGSAAAIEMARAGLDVLVVDRGEFPRFRIGESFLPRTKRAFRRLGVLDRCLALPHARKVGVEITMGDLRYGARRFFFSDTIGNGEKDAFNMARVHLDALSNAAGCIGEWRSLRIYVRDAEHVALFASLGAASFADALDSVLVAPLCRPELLVEVEGVRDV